MKKQQTIPLLIALALALFAGGALAAIPDKPSSFQFVYDYTNTLSQADKDEIADYGQALLDATGGSKDGDEAVALVVDFLDGMEPADYATDVINTWGLGDNSLLVLLATGDRAIEIAAGRGLDRLFSAASRGEVIDANLEYLKNNQFADGLVAIYEAAVTRTATLRGKTLSLPGKETENTAGTATGAVSRGTSQTGGGTGMGILGILVILVVIFVVVRMFRRGGGNGRPPRARSGGVFTNPPPPPQRQTRTTTPPAPQRQTRTTTPPAPSRDADGSFRTGVFLGSLFSGASRSTRSSSRSSSSSSSRSSGASSRSSSSSGSLGRSGGSRGSSSGRKF